MKRCCEKYKKATNIEIETNTENERHTFFIVPKTFEYCPECGSSLKQESKYCECKSMEMTPYYVREYRCDKCGKQVAPFNDGSKPKPKLPDELLIFDDSLKLQCDITARKWINQLIDYLKAKE